MPGRWDLKDPILPRFIYDFLSANTPYFLMFPPNLR